MRLEGDRRAAIARINALLARPAEAPLSTPQALRPIPAVLPPIAALVERAKAGNPQLWSLQAEIRQADTQRQLAGKAWYPDVTITAGPIQRANGPTGASATLSFLIPCSRGRRTQAPEAAANFGAGGCDGCYYGADRR